MEPASQGRTTPPTQDGDAAFPEGMTRKEIDMETSEWMPPGFVPLANWDYRSRGKGDGHSPEYKQLREAYRERRVPGLQTGGERGRIFVHEELANAYLKAHQPAPEVAKPAPPPVVASISSRQTESAVIALCEINNGISLMLVTLERLASAVESIANQRDVSDRLRSEIMATCSERDGFHN